MDPSDYTSHFSQIVPQASSINAYWRFRVNAWQRHDCGHGNAVLHPSVLQPQRIGNKLKAQMQMGSSTKMLYLHVGFYSIEPPIYL